MADSALDGVNVLDLTHYVSGPYCAKLLADFGADVTKVERPGSGDPARSIGPFYHDDPHPDKGLLFLYLNTNKRSITLDLKTDAGKKILKRLAERADILVENFSPRVMPSLGLSYQALREINPRLVMVSISNFGQTGPYRDYKATDIVAYALGGLMYIFGENHREPLKHALRQAQFKAGTNAATAAAIALFHAQRTGQGQWVDVSIQESIASALRDTTSLYTYTGAIRWRQPPASGDVPRSPMKTQDGYVVPVFMGRYEWKDVADLLQAPELLEDRFATPEARVANAAELQAIVTQKFSQRGKFEMFRTAHQRRFPFGVVQSPKEVVENEQYQTRGYFQEIEHPIAGTDSAGSSATASYPGAPFVMSATPWRVRSPAPTLGQHNHEVLCEVLGYSSQDLSKLRSEGII